MTIWFSSDSHHRHANILKFTNRPFETVDEMDQQLIVNWNSVVQETDEVWHLGDFAYRQAIGSLRPIFDRLHGIKHLVRGNHDNDEVFALPWASQQDYKELTINNRKIVLMHYAIVQWNGARHGAIHLHGHHHGTYHYKLEHDKRRLDVGMDCHDLFPISWEQIESKINAR